MDLPSWEESEAAHDAGTATALQEFIYCNEPAGKDEMKQFREMLTDVIGEIVKANSALTAGK
jgi:hypothetical protein